MSYHFIGIGGAGMSAIATVLLQRGTPVSGSDLKDSRYTRDLARKGAKIFVGHKAENINGAEAVVVSTAIPSSNPEVAAAEAAGIPVYRRAEMLARVAEGKQCIAVAGTHGKTTSSSMVSLVLQESGLDPTFVIGGELNDIGTNAKGGEGEFFVAEADESDASLLALNPHVAVVTNVEADHLDFYDSIEQIEGVFAEFLSKLGVGGLAVVCGDDSRLLRLTADLPCQISTYGFGPGNRFRAAEATLGPFSSSYQAYYQDKLLGTITLSVPGMHNILNSLSALAVGMWAGAPFASIAQGLKRFSGVKRRFQLIGEANGFSVVDDYAHHPTEVRATLAAAKSGDWKRVIGVFQPHRYSRTMHLSDDFGEAFQAADVVVLTDVYGAGESPIPGVSGKTLVNSILAVSPGKRVAYFPRRDELADFLLSELRDGDVLLTMGAGDIWSIGEELLTRSAAAVTA